MLSISREFRPLGSSSFQVKFTFDKIHKAQAVRLSQWCQISHYHSTTAYSWHRSAVRNSPVQQGALSSITEGEYLYAYVYVRNNYYSSTQSPQLLSEICSPDPPDAVYSGRCFPIVAARVSGTTPILTYSVKKGKGTHEGDKEIHSSSYISAPFHSCSPKPYSPWRV